MRELRFLWIACMDKKRSGDNYFLHCPKLLFPLPFLQESNAENHRSISSIKTKASQFLKKLSCQKPYRDQVRLSSLVNKQVARRGAGCHGAGTCSYGASRRGAGHSGAGHSGAGRQHCSLLVSDQWSPRYFLFHGSRLALQQSDF